uniref:Uncharacterized protein n=1 Tax=Aegilops tauschii subsp. strangulata TaxID=200361 RepID=A0A452Z5N9_AEGTS
MEELVQKQIYSMCLYRETIDLYIDFRPKNKGCNYVATGIGIQRGRNLWRGESSPYLQRDEQKTLKLVRILRCSSDIVLFHL